MYWYFWYLAFKVIFSSAWFCQQSSWHGGLCPASGVWCLYLNLCRNIISGPIKCIPFKFQLQELNQGRKRHFWKTKHVFWFFLWIFQLLLTLYHMGAKTSKRYSSLKSLLNLFKLVLNFLLSGPHNSTFFDFWNFEFLIFHDLFFVFHNMGPYGSQNFKTLLLPQITFEFFVTCPEFSSQWYWQKYFFGILKFRIYDF